MRNIDKFILLAVLLTASCAVPAESDEASVAAPAAGAPLRGLDGRELKNATALRPAAAASLATLRSLVDGGGASSRSFASADEVDRAVVGEGLPMYMIGLLPLREFRRGNDVRELLVHENAVLFPIAVGTDVRTSTQMSFDPIAQVWAPTAFGRSTLARASAAMREQIRSRRAGSENLVLVEIPALVTCLIGHDEAGVFYLTSLRDIPEARIAAGTTMEAAGLLERLVPIAQQQDENLLN
jgi:hypothetical protein